MADLSARDEWREGWPVVAVATVGMATGAGLYHYVSSLFIFALEAEFGWSRGDISNAAAFGLLGTFSAPVIGRLADRWGARQVALACILGMAACFCLLSVMSGTFWHFLGISALIGTFAPGCTTLIYGRAVNSWFDNGKGLALGITAAGMSVGAMLFSPVVRNMIAEYGSSGGYLTLAALMVGIAMPLVAVGLREKGSAHSEASQAERGAEPSAARHGWYRTNRRTFWILAVAILAANAPAAGVLTQFEPLLAERGITDPTPYLTLFALAVLAGRIAIGALFDRFDARRVAALVTVGGIAGSVMLTSGSPAGLLPFAILLIGFLQGAETDVLAYFVARHFGMQSFGSVYGVLLSISMIGTAMGVVGFGQLFDKFSSYDMALFGAAILLVPALLAYLTLPKPQH